MPPTPLHRIDATRYAGPHRRTKDRPAPAYRRWAARAAILAVAASLTGCAFLRGSAEGSAFLADDARHLRLPGVEAERRAVGYRSPFQYQEYGRSRHAGRAEALFLAADGPDQALDIADDELAALAERWHFNRRAAAIDWQTRHDQRLDRGGLRYRRYRHRRGTDAPARTCVAFLRTWAVTVLDPRSRPTRAVFGYHCRPSGDTLDDVDARAWLRRIDTAEPRTPEFHLGQRVPHDPRAGPLARGTVDANWGIDAFPFRRLRHFPIGAGHGASP